MHIEIIEDPKALPGLKADWDSIYAADPEAQIFLTSAWFANWLKKTTFRWFILAAKPHAGAAHYVAFMPMQISLEMKADGSFINELKLGGADFADYMGFICLPEFQDRAILAFAAALKELNWTHFRITNLLASDKRSNLFIKALGTTKLDTKSVERINKEGINSNLYPFVDLPADWSSYLEDRLSSNTRQKAKRFLKKIDETGEFRVTHANAETFEDDLNTLLKFWEMKWAEAKGDKLQSILSNNRLMLRGCFQADSLLLPVLWMGDRPLAAFAILMDKNKRALHFLIGGRDETFNSPPTGFLLHMHSIRWSIQNGFKIYDFLQGNEPYKYMFGAQDRVVKCFTVSTKTRTNLGDKLDRHSLAAALEKSVQLHRDGKFAEAERGYRQIIATDPKNAGALLPLAVLEAEHGHHAAASKLLNTFLSVTPDSAAGWFKLGQAQQTLHDTEGATKSYRKVLELDPKNRDVPVLLLELHQKAKGERTRSPSSLFAV